MATRRDGLAGFLAGCRSLYAIAVNACRPTPGHQIRTLVICLLLVTATASAKQPEGVSSSPVEASSELAVLFIGNSLTNTNDMPAMFEALLLAADVEATVKTVAFPNYGLQDHWLSEKTRGALAEGPWDVVVMQQGPSATEGRPSLLKYSRRFSKLIRPGARPALFMVWPAKSRFFDFDGVCDSYRAAAEAVDGILLPVGEAWRLAWEKDSQLALYGPDGFHPSVAGSYLAALVIFQRLTGRDPRRQPVLDLNLAPEIAGLLQEAAAEANAQPN